MKEIFRPGILNLFRYLNLKKGGEAGVLKFVLKNFVFVLKLKFKRKEGKYGNFFV